LLQLSFAASLTIMTCFVRPIFHTVGTKTCQAPISHAAWLWSCSLVLSSKKVSLGCLHNSNGMGLSCCLCSASPCLVTISRCTISSAGHKVYTRTKLPQHSMLEPSCVLALIQPSTSITQPQSFVRRAKPEHQMCTPLLSTYLQIYQLHTSCCMGFTWLSTAHLPR